MDILAAKFNEELNNVVKGRAGEETTTNGKGTTSGLGTCRQMSEDEMNEEYEMIKFPPNQSGQRPQAAESTFSSSNREEESDYQTVPSGNGRDRTIEKTKAEDLAGKNKSDTLDLNDTLSAKFNEELNKVLRGRAGEESTSTVKGVVPGSVQCRHLSEVVDVSFGKAEIGNSRASTSKSKSLDLATEDYEQIDFALVQSPTRPQTAERTLPTGSDDVEESDYQTVSNDVCSAVQKSKKEENQEKNKSSTKNLHVQEGDADHEDDDLPPLSDDVYSKVA